MLLAEHNSTGPPGPGMLWLTVLSNAIRSRAGLAPLSNLSGPDFAAAVVQERAWEFAADRIRWFDLATA